MIWIAMPLYKTIFLEGFAKFDQITLKMTKTQTGMYQIEIHLSKVSLIANKEYFIDFIFYLYFQIYSY